MAEDEPVPELVPDVGVVAIVYVEPPKTVVAIPAAPLEASVIASPPAEVITVAAWPPKAMTVFSMSERRICCVDTYMLPPRRQTRLRFGSALEVLIAPP